MNLDLCVAFFDKLSTCVVLKAREKFYNLEHEEEEEEEVEENG